ncbi:MAG: hypothetical protein FJX65_04300 [Alphaproteobacteria bacterium]|nr:hypothetical protein [Alphaproteobacteria bacterium]
MTVFADIAFAPYLPWWVLVALAVVGLLLVLVAVWRRMTGVGWRTIALAIGLLALANPALVREERQPLKDVAVVVVDDSQSQSIGDRRTQAQDAVDALERQLGGYRDLEVRVVRSASRAATTADDGTRLFSALERALSDIPAEQVAGAFLVTDGQIHDPPARLEALGLKAPLHALLTGSRQEGDRRLVIEKAPTYGIVGNELQVTVRVVDTPDEGRTTARVTMRIDGGDPTIHRVPVNAPFTLTFVLSHGGQTIVELEAEEGARELTLQNNRAALNVNGVRERLRVLLVSGQPHAGERAWRNLLKSDPSMDLVHFTILRPPEKQDGTSVRELSLIAFPTRELFEVKLSEFDLVIFDNYKRRGILLPVYLENIANYVMEGGAVLEAAGSAFATPLSLYRTALAKVLPAEPTGNVFSQGFKPTLTDQGRRHPVSGDLAGAGAVGAPPTWGRWFRLIDSNLTAGTSLMSGIGDKPLLVLNRAGKGRVAQFLSDHGWLWSRGYEGGGPQLELLRRLVHWLMKEPDLEEEDLRSVTVGNRIDITRRSMSDDDTTVTVTTPSGQKQAVAMTGAGLGKWQGGVLAEESGLYRIDDGQRSTVAAVGAINPREFADVRATGNIVGPLVDQSGGRIAWLADEGVPEVRRVRAGRTTFGRDWMGVIANESYVVTGVRQTPLMPALLTLLLLLGGLVWAWHREGR